MFKSSFIHTAEKPSQHINHDTGSEFGYRKVRMSVIFDVVWLAGLENPLTISESNPVIKIGPPCPCTCPSMILVLHKSGLYYANAKVDWLIIFMRSLNSQPLSERNV